MEILSDTYLTRADELLRNAFEKYKYWFQNGPVAFTAKYSVDTDQNGHDWRAVTSPFCAYIPEKNIGVLSDPSNDIPPVDPKSNIILHNEHDVSANRFHFHKVKEWFCDGDLPIFIHVEKKTACRDPIEWFIYLCKLANKRKIEIPSLQPVEIELWKDLINCLWERAQTDKNKNPLAKEEFEINKEIILEWKRKIDVLDKSDGENHIVKKITKTDFDNKRLQWIKDIELLANICFKRLIEIRPGRVGDELDDELPELYLIRDNADPIELTGDFPNHETPIYHLTRNGTGAVVVKNSEPVNTDGKLRVTTDGSIWGTFANPPWNIYSIAPDRSEDEIAKIPKKLAEGKIITDFPEFLRERFLELIDVEIPGKGKPFQKIITIEYRPVMLSDLWDAWNFLKKTDAKELESITTSQSTITPAESEKEVIDLNNYDYSPPIAASQIADRLGISRACLSEKRPLGKFFHSHAQKQEVKAPRLPWNEFWAYAKTTCERSKKDGAEDLNLTSFEDFQDLFNV